MRNIAHTHILKAAYPAAGTVARRQVPDSRDNAPLRDRPRIPQTPSAINAVGSHTQTTSEAITVNPRAPMKRATPIGDTAIGCIGKNQRCSLSGHRSATPKPPFVHASSSG